MPTPKEVFSKKHSVLVVVSVRSYAGAMEKVRSAWRAGVDGVFLTNPSLSTNSFLNVYERVRGMSQGRWIGLKPVGISPGNAVAFSPKSISGLWLDSPCYDWKDAGPVRDIAALQMRRRERAKWEGLLFGNLFSNYGRPAQEVAQAARLLSRHVDVVVIHGIGWDPPSVREMTGFCEGEGVWRAITCTASISPAQYQGAVDCFIVMGAHRFCSSEPTEKELKGFIREAHQA